jgi:hypothetical protein
LASAATTVWLEIATRASSAFRSGSLNTSHQFAAMAASRGSASFQPSSAALPGTASLNEPATAVFGSS